MSPVIRSKSRVLPSSIEARLTLIGRNLDNPLQERNPLKLERLGRRRRRSAAAGLGGVPRSYKDVTRLSREDDSSVGSESNVLHGLFKEERDLPSVTYSRGFFTSGPDLELTVNFFLKAQALNGLI